MFSSALRRSSCGSFMPVEIGEIGSPMSRGSRCGLPPQRWNVSAPPRFPLYVARKPQALHFYRQNQREAVASSIVKIKERP